MSEYFDGAASKRLSEVEVNSLRSNQHEFQGVAELVGILGRPVGKQYFETTFIYLQDQGDPLSADGVLTFYNARERHPTRNEHRLYYVDNDVLDSARAGDLMVVARRLNGSLMVVIAANNSTSSSQLSWLFGLDPPRDGAFDLADESSLNMPISPISLDVILNALEMDTETADPDYLRLILERLGEGWPSTREASELARSLVNDVDPLVDPDEALLRWFEMDYTLFRTLEKHIVSERLETGFTGPTAVEDFLGFSLSVQNRRKSRSGHSFENHIEFLLARHDLRFARGARTQGNSRPDFLFPGEAEYADARFPPDMMHMLGAKTTAKDRWRQVLQEADRIEEKHLITLEPAISVAQTLEMQSRSLQLVIPARLQASYSPEQQSSLIGFGDFIEFALDTQSRMPRGTLF